LPKLRWSRKETGHSKYLHINRLRAGTRRALPGKGNGRLVHASCRGREGKLEGREEERVGEGRASDGGKSRLKGSP